MQTSTEVGYNSKIEGEVIVTRVDAALNWFRKNSIWPMPMGLMEFLRAGVEGVAGVADADDDARFDRAGLDRVAAGATNFGFQIFRMNVRSHNKGW